MSRLQKKCVLGATTLHALLLLALLVGPAFFTKKEEPLNLPELTIIPDILTDKPFSKEGGAAPGGENNPQPLQDKPVAQPAPQPTPPTPEPPPTREPVAEPEPRPKEIKRPPQPADEDDTKISSRDADKPKKPAAKPHAVTVSNTRVPLNRNTSTTARPNNSRNTSTSTSNNNSALASAIRSTRSNLGSGLSSGTDVRMPAGQGGGSGAAYANYAQAIQRIYKQAYDQALAAAGDIADGQVQIETSVVILSNGTVVSGVIVSPSSNSALNSLTKRVLDSVRQVPAFPAGTKDSRRTFNIIFDLKPKNRIG